MKKTRILYLLLTAAAAFWLWQRYFGDEEGQIRRLLGEIRELVEKSPGEGALDGVGRARSFIELFTEPFAAEVVPVGQRVEDKKQLMQLFVGFRHASERVTLDYRGVTIAVDANGRDAVVTLEAVLNGGPGGFLAGDRFPVELRLRKPGGQWRVARAVVGEVIR